MDPETFESLAVKSLEDFLLLTNVSCAKNWRLSPEAKPHLAAPSSLAFECSGGEEVKSYAGFLKK